MVTRRLLFLDIETFSSASVKKFGVYAHSGAPDFEILMCAYAWDDGPVQVVVGHSAVMDLVRPVMADRNVVKVAHNAQFERVCFSRALFPGEPTKFLTPDRWDDTMAIGAEWGYPQSLKHLAVALGAEEKDEAGTRLINKFCQLNRGKRTMPADAPDDWMDFMAYCHQDVVTLRGIWRELQARHGGWPTEAERAVWEADQVINDRGVPVDVGLARAAVEAGEFNKEEAEAELAELAGVSNPSSVVQLLPALRAMPGLEDLQSLRADELDALAGLPPLAARAVELRRDLAMSASKKFQVALNLVTPEDNRLRGAFRFFGAHTGRWAGRGVQLQNLPRASLTDKAMVAGLVERGMSKDEAETKINVMMTDAAVLDLQLGFGASPHALKALIRPMFKGSFTVVDYAAIEARVIAWLAGEEWALEAFRAGRDIYVETAERMSTPSHQLNRSQGKVAVLALGYGGAVNSLRAMGAEGSDADLLRLVTQWRSANPRVVGLWAELDQAFKYGGPVGSHLRVEVDGRSRYLVLPSGRSIGYHGYKVRQVSKAGREPAPVMTFWDPQRRHPYIATYGGKLAENATQAVARDLLAHALVQLERNGLGVVMHIHDEVVVEGDNVGLVNAILCDAPGWAEGLPVAGAGFHTVRYRKG